MNRLRSSRKGLLGASAVATTITLVLFACSSDDPLAPVAAIDGGDASAADTGFIDATRDVVVDATDDDGDFVVPDTSVACAVTPCVTKLVGSADGFCAVLSDGRASCWGSNYTGWLGVDPQTTSVPNPSLVQGVTGITDLAMGGESTCARTSDGSVWCWGSLDFINAGAFMPDGGDPIFGYTPTPTREELVPAAESISLGTGFACARIADGSLSCWGTNEYRELGRGATDDGPTPPPAKATLLGLPAAAVVAGSSRTFVITQDGSVLSWGSNKNLGAENLLLGRDTSEDPIEKPTRIPLLARVRDISTNAIHSCAIAGRFVECWGSNGSGQLGRGGFERLDYLPDRTVLADVTDDDDEDAGEKAGTHDVPAQVATGRSHSCAALGSGRVYCWGDASAARVLGPRVEANVVRGTPTRVDGFGGPVVGLAAGLSSTCALLRTGAVECWGANDVGQLGTGTVDLAPHPTPARVTFAR